MRTPAPDPQARRPQTLAGFPLTVAAPNGLAWDSVTKVVTNADPSTLQPGSFDTDYAAAAAAPPSGGGMAGQVKQGIAEQHYAAGSKDRTDNVAQQTATIVDCVARTITTLDLRRKTYNVVSMDQSASPSSGGGVDRCRAFSETVRASQFR